MAVTFSQTLTPAKVDSMFIVSAPVLSTAEIGLGSIVLYDVSNHYISDEMAAAADEDTVLGVALGESRAASEAPIPVATRGIFKATLVSATYKIGQSLKYDDSADNGSLVTDAGVNTLCWFWSYLTSALSSATAITAGYVWFDLTRMIPQDTPADRLWMTNHA